MYIFRYIITLIGDLENTMLVLLACRNYLKCSTPNDNPQILCHYLKYRRSRLKSTMTLPYNRTFFYMIYYLLKATFNLFAVSQRLISHCVSSRHCFVKLFNVRVKLLAGGSVAVQMTDEVLPSLGLTLVTCSSWPESDTS